MKELQQIGSQFDLTFSERSSPISNFLDSFRLVVVTTPRLQEEVYRIRYKVYCQELGYEREEDCKNGMEQDIYDQRSIHCLLMHTRSGLYAGCVRLVLPDWHQAAESCQGGNPPSKLFKTGASLPFERVYGHTSQSNSPELKNLPRHSFGEVSRLAVTTEFRQPKGAVQRQFSEDEKRYFPLIPLGLYLGATSVALEMELDSVFALMEPRLSRHLARFGIQFQQMGELVEFHGQRALYQVSKEAVMNSMKISTEDLYQRLRIEVKKSLRYCPITFRAA